MKTSGSELPHFYIVGDRLVMLGKRNFTKNTNVIKKLALMKKKTSCS